MNAEQRFGRELRTWAISGLLATCVLIAGVALRGCDGHMVSVHAQDEPIAQYRTEAGMALPDPAVTPGEVSGAVVADLSGAEHKIGNVEMNICAKDFRATAIRKTIRNFGGLKKQACEEYGISKCDGHVEGDHLISLEIGGCPDCLRNLWPQPMDEARVKDHQVEDKLPKLICAGKITLTYAQGCIAKDWIECGEQIKQFE